MNTIANVGARAGAALALLAVGTLAQTPEPPASEPAAPPDSVFAGLALDLKTFTDKQSNSSALGFAFDYDRTWDFGTPVTDRGVPVLATALAVRARGNVSLDADVAPDDFLVAQLGFDGVWFLRTDPLRPQEEKCDLHLGLRLHGGGEADQRFTARNTTFGASLVVDLQAGPASALADWNPFDLPFRLGRWLSGYRERDGDTQVVNRAEAIPALLFTVEDVHSSGTDPRQQVGDTDNFVRLSAEAALSAAFLRVGEWHVAAELDYRVWYEPNASAAVRGSDLDLRDYLVVALKVGGDSLLGRDITRADGVFVSWRTGQQPFDVADADVFEVGFRVHF